MRHLSSTSSLQPHTQLHPLVFRLVFTYYHGNISSTGLTILPCCYSWLSLPLKRCVVSRKVNWWTYILIIITLAFTSVALSFFRDRFSIHSESFHCVRGCMGLFVSGSAARCARGQQNVRCPGQDVLQTPRRGANAQRPWAKSRGVYVNSNGRSSRGALSTECKIVWDNAKGRERTRGVERTWRALYTF